jgi:putative heme degradation protein
MACYFAVKTQTKKQLKDLLNKYLTQGLYYYNVVVTIDRALYAPKDLVAVFLSDEQKWAAQWD